MNLVIQYRILIAKIYGDKIKVGILQLGFGVIEHIDLVSDFQSGHSELLLQFLFVFTLFDINEIIGIDINCSAVRLLLYELPEHN